MEKLFDGEYKLMEVLWEAGAVHSAQLVELCAQRLGWNKSTDVYKRQSGTPSTGRRSRCRRTCWMW